MYSPKRIKKSLIRLALIIMMGFSVIAGSPSTVNGKEKMPKAMKDKIAGAKTPADHKAIADYYYAEAAKARANADKHEQMAEDYREWYRTAGKGWSKGSYAPGTIEHCEGLVKDYRAAAEELTALAKEQEDIIAGGPTTVAKDKISKPVEKEQKALTDKSPVAIKAQKKMSKAMKEMIEGAKTAADHKAIADYYYAEAAKDRANADKHKQMAEGYREWYETAGKGWSKGSYAPGTIEHCKGLVKDYTAAAEDLTALAKEHEAMAAKLK